PSSGSETLPRDGFAKRIQSRAPASIRRAGPPRTSVCWLAFERIDRCAIPSHDTPRRPAGQRYWVAEGRLHILEFRIPESNGFETCSRSARRADGDPGGGPPENGSEPGPVECPSLAVQRIA